MDTVRKKRTYGERAVSLSFYERVGHPDTEIKQKIFDIKVKAAALIDEIWQQRKNCTDGEMIANYILAIRNIQQGQSWAIKAVTYDPKEEIED